MKKLLTILTLALALCLICGAALADVEKYPGNVKPAVGDKIKDEAGNERNVWKVEQLDAHSKDAEFITYRCFMKSIDGASNTNEYKDYLVNEHNVLGNITATTPATCWVAGSYTAKCSVCGYETTSTIPAGKKVNATTHLPTDSLGHSKAGGQWIDKIRTDATCTTEGVNGIYCTVCKTWDPNGDTKTGLYDVHIYTKKIEIAPYTCQGNGSWYWACVNCDKKDPNRGTQWVTTIAAYQTLLGDVNYVTVSDMPWDYDGHNYTAWGKESEPTCAKAATYVRWCKNGCGATQSKAGTAPADLPLNALWKVVQPQELTCVTKKVKVVCSRCEGAADAPAKHKAKEVTPTANGEVYAPDATYTAADNAGAFLMTLPHVFKINDTYKLAKVAATCTKGAYYPYKCFYEDETGHPAAGKYDYYEVPVTSEPALGHNWEDWHVSTAVDENGNHYYWRRCKRCGETQREFQVPTELCDVHDFKVTTEPTCTEAGEKTCSKCGTTEEIAALGHDWDETIKKAATCKEEGLKNRVCKRCGTGETDIKVEKLAHTWDEGKITKEATKEADGEKTFTCTVCGETKTEAVKWEPAKDPKYTMTASYNGTAVTGKLVHDDSTVEAAAKFVRVTFYVEGNYYMATMAEVEADGTFSVDGVGPIVYITAVATGNSSVNPEDVKVIAPAVEIFVK